MMKASSSAISDVIVDVQKIKKFVSDAASQCGSVRSWGDSAGQAYSSVMKAVAMHLNGAEVELQEIEQRLQKLLTQVEAYESASGKF